MLMQAREERAEARVLTMEKQIAELSRDSIPGVPIESCPPTSSNNPWRPVKGSIVEGTLILHDKETFKIECLEFFPCREAFPNCYYRLNAATHTGTRIPAETVILPQAEASSVLAEQARALGFKQLDKGFLESGQLVFSARPALKCPL